MGDVGQTNLEGDILYLLNQAKTFRFHDWKSPLKNPKDQLKTMLKFIEGGIELGKYTNVKPGNKPR